jgi:DNA-binding NarL/FixJ family response regulator
LARQKIVLVIGGHAKVVPAVREILPAWEIAHADSNREALVLLRERPYDLVLTDEETKGRDDVELLRQIRLIRPHTRLIILTNESTPLDVIGAMRERAFSYFSEPYSMNAFADMVLLATTSPVWDEGIEILAATEQWIRLLVRGDLATADRLLQFIHEVSDLPPEEKQAVGLSFREMLMNAVEHGAHFDPTQLVEISYVRAKHMVMCRVKDPGPGFNLEEMRHAAANNPPDDPLAHVKVRKHEGLRAGGFGILLAQKAIDELIYSEQGNDVLLIKYLKSQDGSRSGGAEP